MNLDRVGQLHFIRGFVYSEPEGGAGPVHSDRPARHSLVAAKSSAVASRIPARRGELEIDDETGEPDTDGEEPVVPVVDTYATAMRPTPTTPAMPTLRFVM